MLITAQSTSEEDAMGIWILTQDRRHLLLIHEIRLAGAKITGYSQRHPTGLLLGKYGDGSQAQSVFQRIAAKLKEAEMTLFYEMPLREGY